MILTSAHLLSNHHGTRCDRSSPESRNCKELGETGDVVVLYSVSSGLGAKLRVDVVKVASSLELCVSETFEGRVCLLHFSFLDVPSGGLR